MTYFGRRPKTPPNGYPMTAKYYSGYPEQTPWNKTQLWHQHTQREKTRKPPRGRGIYNPVYYLSYDALEVELAVAKAEAGERATEKNKGGVNSMSGKLRERVNTVDGKGNSNKRKKRKQHGRHPSKNHNGSSLVTGKERKYIMRDNPDSQGGVEVNSSRNSQPPTDTSSPSPRSCAITSSSFSSSPPHPRGTTVPRRLTPISNSSSHNRRKSNRSNSLHTSPSVSARQNAGNSSKGAGGGGGQLGEGGEGGICQGMTWSRLKGSGSISQDARHINGRTKGYWGAAHSAGSAMPAEAVAKLRLCMEQRAHRAQLDAAHELERLHNAVESKRQRRRKAEKLLQKSRQQLEEQEDHMFYY